MYGPAGHRSECAAVSQEQQSANHRRFQPADCKFCPFRRIGGRQCHLSAIRLTPTFRPLQTCGYKPLHHALLLKMSRHGKTHDTLKIQEMLFYSS